MGRHESDITPQPSAARDASAATTQPKAQLSPAAHADAAHGDAGGIGGVPVWFRAGDELHATDFDVRDAVHPEMAAPKLDSTGQPREQLAGATTAPFYLAENLAQPDTSAVKDLEAHEVPSAMRELPATRRFTEDAQDGNRPVAAGLRGNDDLPKDDFKQQDRTAIPYVPAAGIAGASLAGAGLAQQQQQQRDFWKKDAFKQDDIAKKDLPKDDFKQQEFKQQDRSAAPYVAGAGIAGAGLAGAGLAQRDFSKKDDFKQDDIAKKDLPKDDFKQQEFKQQDRSAAPYVAGAGIAGAGLAGAGLAQRDYSKKDDFKQEDITPTTANALDERPLPPPKEDQDKSKDLKRQDLVKEDYKQHALNVVAGATGLGVLGAGLEPEREMAADYYGAGRVAYAQDDSARQQVGVNGAGLDDDQPPAGWHAPTTRFDYLPKGANITRQRLAKKDLRQKNQRSDQVGYGFANEAPVAFRDVQSRPPLRHWGYEPAIVCQADIDQKPNYKRKARAPLRLRRWRRSIAWVIPAELDEKKESGGVAWLVSLDDDRQAATAEPTAAPTAAATEPAPAEKPKKKKKSAVGKLLKGFTGLFKSHKHAKAGTTETAAVPAATATASQPAAIAVRPQRRIASRGIPKADVTNVPQRLAFGRVMEANPPLAPIVEKKAHIDIDPQQPRVLESKVDIITATANAPAGVTSRRTMRHEVVSVANMPLFRQAPGMEDARKMKSGDRLEFPDRRNDVAWKEFPSNDVKPAHQEADIKKEPTSMSSDEQKDAAAKKASMQLHPQAAPPAMPSDATKQG